MSDDALIEAMAKAMSESGNKDWMYAEDWFKDIYIGQAIAALAVCRPIIQAETLEKCAKIADGMEAELLPEKQIDDIWYAGARYACTHIAAAIRENGND